MKPIHKIMSFRNAIKEAIRQEMKRDKNVFLMGEDIGQYGGAFGVTAGLFEEFGPQRILDTPISEAAIAGTAIGSALMGKRPIIEAMFMDFTPIMLNQLVNQASRYHFKSGGQVMVPMVLRTAFGSGTGGGPQHTQSLEAWFTSVPGLKVVVPSTPYDAKGLLISSIRDNNPVIFMEHKLLYDTKGMVPDELYPIPIGKADLKRKGADLSIITYGNMVLIALETASTLAKEGIDTEVLDLRSLKPLDTEAVLSSVEKTGRVILLQQANLSGGISAEIAAQISTTNLIRKLKKPIVRLAALDTPSPYNLNLEAATLPGAGSILDAARNLFS